MTYKDHYTCDVFYLIYYEENHYLSRLKDIFAKYNIKAIPNMKKPELC